MDEYDIIVIGAGSGLNVASAYAKRGKDVAVVEPGPMGGTCLNRGCIPSKMLIHHADIIDTVEDAYRFNINATVNDIDYTAIIEEVNTTVEEDAEAIENGITDSDRHTLYKAEATFVDENTIEVDGEQITADTIVVAAGTRPMIPPVNGIETVDYLTSKEALRLLEQPEDMVIIGGGYIASELAHFFNALGTDITIIEMGDVLLGHEDREISEAFTEIFSDRDGIDVNLGMKAAEVSENKEERVEVVAEDKEGETKTFEADQLLVAAGRVPNTDVLNVDEAGIETDERGFIEVDDHLETSVDGIYALGDIAGNYLFKHSANLESRYVFINAFTEEEEDVDYTAMPHAVFSHPEIAGVGKTEQQLEEDGTDYVAGTYAYENTGRGLALKEKDGFVKVLAHPETREILGCHIMGPHASSLIHEVLVAMRHGSGTVDDIAETVHVHPALNEVVERAFNQV